MTDLATVTRERDKLAAEVRRLQAEQQVGDSLSASDLPSAMIPFARSSIVARGVTSDGKTGVLIGYASPADAAAEFMRARGPELIAAHARSVAGQRATGGDAPRGQETPIQPQLLDAKAKTITRTDFFQLSPKDQMKAMVVDGYTVVD
ncbi:MAG TPA: hypothetical protein VFE10_10360 [Phenylobacterium sp.]|jgi:hypothetical protein|nr:hypothetical protein [Phenylobacterium sp.]